MKITVKKNIASLLTIIGYMTCGAAIAGHEWLLLLGTSTIATIAFIMFEQMNCKEALEKGTVQFWKGVRFITMTNGDLLFPPAVTTNTEDHQ